MIGNPPLCLDCKWRDPISRACVAFPKGIPDAIMDGKFDHHKPYDGDNGITYEPGGPTPGILGPKQIPESNLKG